MTTPTAVDREALRLGAFMPPWLLPLDIDPTRAIRGELETVEYLEGIGFHEAWIGEHNSGGVELISSPELFIAGEVVTQSSEWFELREAQLHIGPHTHPRPEIVVASAITPSGGTTAGRV